MEKSSLLGVEERKTDDLALRMGKEIWDDFSNASFMYVGLSIPISKVTPN